MLRRAIICVLPMLLLLTLRSRALGQGLTFDYQAPTNCPTVDAFRAAVTHRVEHLKPESIPNCSLVVRIEAVGRSYVGSLLVGTPRENSVERSITAGRCDALVEALALVVSVVLNPDTSPLDLENSTRKSADTEPAAPKSDPKSTANAPIAAAREPTTWPPEAAKNQQPVGISMSPRQALGLLLSAGVGVDQSATSYTVVGPRLGISALVRHESSWDISSGMSATPPVSHEVSSGASLTKLKLAAIRFECCGNLHVGSGFGLGSCVLAEFGRLSGSNSANPTTEGSTRWVATGTVLRGQARVSSVFGLYADLGLVWPMVRGNFVLSQPAAPEREIVVYEVPSQIPTATVGAVLQIL